jgi:hypothetical protein
VDEDVCAKSGNEVLESDTLLLLLSLLSLFSFSSSRHETSASPLIRSSSAVFSSEAKLFCRKKSEKLLQNHAMDFSRDSRVQHLFRLCTWTPLSTWYLWT